MKEGSQHTQLDQTDPVLNAQDNLSSKWCMVTTYTVGTYSPGKLSVV